MTARGERQIDANKLRWFLAVMLALLGVWAAMTYVQDSLLYRLLVILGALMLSVTVVAQTDQGRTFWGLLRASRLEIRKVVWPTHQETVQTLLLVVVFVLLMAVLLWILDSFLGWLAGALIG